MIVVSFAPVSGALIPPEDLVGRDGSDPCDEWPGPPVIPLGGICDGWNSLQDGTPNSQEWVYGLYSIEMVNTSVIKFDMEWRMHEFNKDTLGASSVFLGNDSEGAGLPADHLRNFFSITPAGEGDSIQNLVLENAKGNVESVGAGFGTVTESGAYYVDQTDAGGEGTISCSVDENTDSAAEGNSAADPYYPPICIHTSATITLDAAALNIADSPELDIERTYQGLLIMGSQITSNFQIFASPGHKSIFEIHPPDYATFSSVGSVNSTCQDDLPNSGANCEGVTVPRTSATNHGYMAGKWVLDNLDGAGTENYNHDIWLEVSAGNSIENPVNIDTANDKGVSVTLNMDMRNENAVTVEMLVGLHYIDGQTMNDWGFNVVNDIGNAQVPWVTSDGIRLVHHNGIANLSAIATNMPTESVTSGLEGFLSSGQEVSMPDFEWYEDGSGGLEFTHTQGTTCSALGLGEGIHSHYCLRGPDAMNGDYPVLLKSKSSPFQLGILDVAQKQTEEQDLPLDLSLLSNSDLQDILNSNVKLGIDLGESFIGDMVPQDLPPTEITLNIYLPAWVRHSDGGEVLTLSHLIEGTSNSEISIGGANPWDWKHDIKDENGNVICTSTQQTCAAVDVNIDFSSLDIDEWSKAVSLKLGGFVELKLYRLGIPDGILDINDGSNTIEMEAVPSDLLRLMLDISGRSQANGGGPLYSTSVDVAGKDLQLEVTQNGLTDFANNIGGILTDEIHKMGTTEEGFSVDLSGIQVTSKLTIGSLSGGVDDSDPIVFRLNLLPRTVHAQYTNVDGQQGININTKSMYSSPLFRITQNFVNSAAQLVPGVASTGEGFEISDQGSPFSIEIEGPDLSTGVVDFAPNVMLTVKFPPGIGFKSFTSENGNAKMERVGGQQQLVYTLPTKNQVDTIYFTVVIGWTFILGEIGMYLGVVLGLVGMLIMRRRAKRKKKATQLERDFEKATHSASRNKQLSTVAGYGGAPGYNDGWDMPAPVTSRSGGSGGLDDDISQFMY